MAFTAAAQDALLKWVNSFPLTSPVLSIANLADGVALSQVLQDLDSTFDAASSDLVDKNTTSSTWLAKKRNLQAVTKGLVTFMRREAQDCIVLTQTPEFRAITENPDNIEGLCRLVTVFLAAAILNSNEDVRRVVIQRLQSDLGEQEQLEMRDILQQKQVEIELASESANSNQTIKSSGGRDADLEAEEERLRIAAQLDRKSQDLQTMTKKYVDLDTRLGYLQESYDDLKDKLKTTETELDDLQKLHSTDESQRTHALQRKVDESAHVIAGLEVQIDQLQTQQQHYQTEIDKLNLSTRDTQEYKDKYDELSHQTKELERRANAADRYKQKLTAQRDYEQELATMQYELEEKKHVHEQLQKTMLEKTRLEKTQAEMMSAMDNNERSLFEERDQKERLKTMADELRNEITHLLHQASVNEKYIEEMKEQVGANGGLPATTIDSPGKRGQANFNLEDELEHSTDPTLALNLTVSRLKAENALLRNNMGAGSQIDQLRAENDKMALERDIAIKQHSLLFEKWAVGQEQINVFIEHSDSEKNLTVQNMRAQMSKAEASTDAANKRIRILEQFAADKEREVLQITADFTHAGDESLDMLERLKNSDELVSRSLKSELHSLRTKYDGLEAERDMYKSQLLDALVEKDKLSHDINNESNSKIESTTEPVVTVTPPPPPPSSAPQNMTIDEDETLAAREQRFQLQQTKIDKLREYMRKAREVHEKYELERNESNRRIKELESGAAVAAQKESYESQILNLTRENRAITTAWFDLKTRVQSNLVVLQRKEQPKSWLNKQRQLVNATPRR